MGSTELRMGPSGEGGKGAPSSAFTGALAPDVSPNRAPAYCLLSVLPAPGLFLSHQLVAIYQEKEVAQGTVLL